MPLAPFECESHPRSRCSKAKSPRRTKECGRWCKPPDWHQQNKSSSPGWGGGNCPSRFRRPLAGLVVIVNSNRWFAPPATFLHAYGVKLLQGDEEGEEEEEFEADASKAPLPSSMYVVSPIRLRRRCCRHRPDENLRVNSRVCETACGAAGVGIDSPVIASDKMRPSNFPGDSIRSKRRTVGARSRLLLGSSCNIQ